MTDFDTPDHSDDDEVRSTQVPLPDGYEFWDKNEMTARPGIFHSNWAYVIIIALAVGLYLIGTAVFAAETAYLFCDRRDNGDIVIHVPPGSTNDEIQLATEQCKRTLAMLETLSLPTLKGHSMFPSLMDPKVKQ